ncbi:endoplasmic reticulum protein [Pelomyxa schiedti]|nr:endoplasmic reticulum protein [Pelomyxa schiedti]
MVVGIALFVVGFVLGSCFFLYVAYSAIFSSAGKCCHPPVIDVTAGTSLSKLKPMCEERPDLQGSVRLRREPVLQAEPPLSWLALKNKTIFCFLYEGARDYTSVFSIEGCSVSLFRAKYSKYHKENSIHLENKTRELFPGCNECWLSCDYGIELEKWHHALAKATGQMTLNTPKIVSHFSTLIGNLACSPTTSTSGVASVRDPNVLKQLLAPINAGFHRLFWGVHDNPTMLEFLEKKVNQKFNRLHLPPFVTRLRVKQLVLGPNLPVVFGVDLLSLSPAGELVVDAEFMYAGGFHISIELQIDVAIPVVKHHVNIPLVITVALSALAGKVRVHCLAPPSQRMWVGFHSEPVFEFSIDTQVGAMSRVEMHQIPKLANIVIARIRAQLVEQVVLPNMDDWPVPRPPKVKPAISPHGAASVGPKAPLQPKTAPPLPPKPISSTPIQLPSPNQLPPQPTTNPPIPPKPASSTHHPPPLVGANTQVHSPESSFSLPEVPSGIQLVGNSSGSSASAGYEPKPPVPPKHSHSVFTLPTVEEMSFAVSTKMTSLRRKDSRGES